MKIIECYLTNNDRYKSAVATTPKGIVVHSTGVNQVNLKRFVQPSDDNPNKDEILNILGVNANKNSWNRPGVDKLVHFMIGYGADRSLGLQVAQLEPCNRSCAGTYKGINGTYNTSHIQFEMLEDGLEDEAYFNAMIDKAVELCVYLCKEYNIQVSEICSHKEAADRGFASFHGDPENWLTKFGKDMDWFRAKVQAVINAEKNPAVTLEDMIPEGKMLVDKEEFYRMENILAQYSKENAELKERCGILEVQMDKIKSAVEIFKEI